MNKRTCSSRIYSAKKGQLDSDAIPEKVSITFYSNGLSTDRLTTFLVRDPRSTYSPLQDAWSVPPRAYQ